MRVLSLGWGVQSMTLAVMAALGELEPIDVALHSDTGYESKLTYEFAEKWTPWLEAHGVRVVTVKPEKNDLFTVRKTGKLFCIIPAYYGRSDGYAGMTRRQCATNWKIDPQRKWISQNRNKKPVEQWMGISLDEVVRMRQSYVKYITNRYPLVEKRMKRGDCIVWLDRHGIEIPPKSACVFCPYHSLSSWRQTKNVPEDWSRVVDVDNIIRDYDPPFSHYLTNKLIPIDELDLSTPEERGQLILWENELKGCVEYDQT